MQERAYAVVDATQAAAQTLTGRVKIATAGTNGVEILLFPPMILELPRMIIAALLRDRIARSHLECPDNIQACAHIGSTLCRDLPPAAHRAGGGASVGDAGAALRPPRIA
jgi:hypothetical protein